MDHSIQDDPNLITPTPGNTPIHALYDPSSYRLPTYPPPPSPAFTPTPTLSQYGSYSQLPTARIRNDDTPTFGFSPKIYINIISPSPSPKFTLFNPNTVQDFSYTPSPVESPTPDYLSGSCKDLPYETDSNQDLNETRSLSPEIDLPREQHM